MKKKKRGERITNSLCEYSWNISIGHVHHGSDNLYLSQEQQHITNKDLVKRERWIWSLKTQPQEKAISLKELLSSVFVSALSSLPSGVYYHSGYKVKNLLQGSRTHKRAIHVYIRFSILLPCMYNTVYLLCKVNYTNHKEKEGGKKMMFLM